MCACDTGASCRDLTYEFICSKDRRFDAVKGEPIMFYAYWTIQVCVWGMTK